MSEYEKPGGKCSPQPGLNQCLPPQNSGFEPDNQAPNEQQFRDAMEAAGLAYPTTGFNPDGQRHAFDGEGIGEDSWFYWYDGATGGWQAPDGRQWRWQAGQDRARRIWPEPQALKADISAKDYPLDALPEKIRAAVSEVQGYIQAPVPLVAASCLSALSTVGQAHVDVRRDSKLQGSASLFFLTIADSGERKSTADGYFSKTIRDYEGEQAEAKKPEIERYKAMFEAWQAKRTGIRDKIKQLAKKGQKTDDQQQVLIEIESEKPTAPRVPRLLYSDTTSEELGHRLATGWPSGAIISAEAGLVFGSHAMSSDSLMRTLGLYNILWDGGTAQIDRRTSKSFTLKRARLTIGLQIQEAALLDFMRRGGDLARGIGFFARYLIAWPESTQGTRFYKPAPQHWPALAAFNQRMSELLNRPVPMDETGTLTPHLIDLSPEAKRAWIDFYNAIEKQQGKSGDLFDLRDIASKIADNAARLAVLFHLYEVGPYGEVSRELFEGAARIAIWHLNEARRFFGGLTVSEEQRQIAELDAWLLKTCQDGGRHHLTQRDILRQGPNQCRKKSVLEPLLAKLEELGRIRQSTTGRTKLIFQTCSPPFF